jgi:hypothetical protein
MQSSAKRGRVSVSKSVAAPVGGLNALNALADMPETDAIILDNWFPRTSDLVIRNGYQAYATGMSGSIETLMAYRSSTAQKMFGIVGGSIYDVTNQGAVGAAVKTGLSNSRWQYVNFGTVGGRFVYAVNGTDYPLIYDGTTWLNVGSGTGAVISTITFLGTTATVTTVTPHGLVNGALVTVTVTGAAPSPYNVTAVAINVTGASTFTYTMGSTPATNATTPGTFTYTPAIQGVDPRLLKNCDAINSRMWFVEKNSLRAWYLTLNSIGGAAASIDLTSLSKQGGSLAGVFGWATASVYGMINYTVFITTEGEVIVYQGYDPTNAATWSLASRGRIGAPVGERFWTRIATDVGIIGLDGVVPLSKAMQVDRSSDSEAISYKIVNAINSDISTYKNNFGWQLQVFPLNNMLIINVPTQPDAYSYQYVMNTVTNAWCRYTGLNANCWEFLNDNLFFGGNDGKVYQAEYGYSDNNAPIVATGKQAFSYFGDGGTEKRFTGVRPVISATGGAKVVFDINIDFEDKAPLSTPTFTLPSSPLYWSFPWPSPWGPNPVVTKQLQYASGIGYAAAAKIVATNKFAPISWQATTFMYERGGPI